MTLNGRYALCCRKDASFGAHHKNLNEDWPILSAVKCRPMTLVSGGIRFMWIFAEIPRGDGVKRQCGCRQRQFSAFSMAIFRILWRWSHPYYMAISSPSSAFHWSQNAWPWMTLNGYFALNFVFALVWLAETGWLRKIIAWKLTKIDRPTYCQRRKSLTGILVSGNIRFVRIFGRVL